MTARPGSSGRMSAAQGNRPESSARVVVEQPLPILPTGIVENTAEVYREVAGFETIPPEKLHKYWRVYTVTHKKLFHPTANRLENFWWHVWGSQRRTLSGKTVARLYKEISTGPTFVPLQTPATRYDGPTIPNFSPVRSRKADTGTSQAADEVKSSKDMEPERKHVPVSDAPPTQSIQEQPQPSPTARPTPHVDPPLETSSQGTEDANRPRLPENSSVASIDDATTASAGSASKSTDTRKVQPSRGEASSSAASSSSKAAPASKPEPRKTVKAKPAKKKFVVSAAGAAKKRPLMARRGVSHSSQGSHSSVGSEGPGARGAAATSHPTRRTLAPEITEEDEAMPGAVEIDDLSALVSPIDQAQPQQGSVQTPAQRSDKAAGKQPIRPYFASPMERTLSQASESTVISSMSGSTIASVATGAPVDAAVSSVSELPARVEPSPAPAKVVVSTSTPDMPGPVRQSVGPAAPSKPGLVRQSTMPSVPTMPGLARQSTMPLERSPIPRQQMMRAGSATSLARMKSPMGAQRPSSAYMSQISTAAPSTPPSSMTTFAAPLMGRSISQDSYGYRPRLLGQNHPSPTLSPMRSATVVAPSMIAANGQFMDPEGPDTFSFYAKTGLDDDDKEEDDDDPEMSSSFKGETSSSFGSGSHDATPATQRPLFAPTRPTQTPRIPFARTRSQLNVILDREKERLGKGTYNSWNESRSRDHPGA